MNAAFQFIFRPRFLSAQGGNAGSAGNFDGDALLLLQAAKRELCDTAILTIITCGSINSLDHLEVRHLERAEFGNVPPDPIVLPVTIAQLRSDRVCPEAQVLFKNFLHVLYAAKHLLEVRLAGAQPVSSEANWDELVASWTEVTNRLLLCIYEIERIIGISSPISGDSIEEVCNNLILVKDGKCLPEKSDMLWRRSCRRIRVNLEATVRNRGRTSCVRVLDASRRGMGLDFAKDLAVGDIVNVELENGRRFIARVVWSNLGRAGLELATQLSANDPLISGG